MPQEVVQWTMRKLLVDRWSRISKRINKMQSEYFELNIDVHQRSVLNLFVFVTGHEAILYHKRGLPQGLLDVDGLALCLGS